MVESKLELFRLDFYEGTNMLGNIDIFFMQFNNVTFLEKMGIMWKTKRSQSELILSYSG